MSRCRQISWSLQHTVYDRVCGITGNRTIAEAVEGTGTGSNAKSVLAVWGKLRTHKRKYEKRKKDIPNHVLMCPVHIYAHHPPLENRILSSKK